MVWCVRCSLVRLVVCEVFTCSWYVTLVRLVVCVRCSLVRLVVWCVWCSLVLLVVWCV